MSPLHEPPSAARREGELDLAESEPLAEVNQVHQQLARERAEPRDGHEPAPLLFLLVCFGLFAWGGFYAGVYHGDFAPDLFTEDFEGLSKEPPPPAPPQEPRVLGRRVFKNNCAVCHQAEGQGLPGAYPPLAGSDWIARDPEVLARVLLHGLGGEIKVNGVAYSGNMPSWAHLPNAQLAGVLTYLRSTWGNQAGPVDEELVSKVRSATGNRSAPWTADELSALESKLEPEPARDGAPQ